MERVFTVVAAKKNAAAEPPAKGYTALELVRLLQEWEKCGVPTSDKEAEVLARFAFAIHAFGKLSTRDAVTLNMRLVKAIFGYGKVMGAKGELS